MVRLYPVTGGRQPVAWSDDGRTFLSASGAVFGWRDGDVVYSEVGGEPLGFFSGDDFFSNDGKPLYFLDRRRGRQSGSCGQSIAGRHVSPVDFQLAWGGHPEDLTVTTSGEVSVATLDASMQAMLSDARYRPGMRVLADYRLSELDHLTSEDLRRRADLLPAKARFDHQRVAWVVSRPVDYGMVRVLHAYREPRTAIVWRLFYDIHEARDWLKEAV